MKLAEVFEDGRRERVAWSALATGSAVVTAGLARKAARSGWRRAMNADPPLNPASPDTPWKEAVVWAIGAGICVGLARLAARRLAASGWRRATGRLPPL